MFEPYQPGVERSALDDLDFGRVLDRLASHTRTVLGEQFARVPRLFVDRSRVERELALTTEMRSLVDRSLVPPIGGISDVRPILAHASKRGVLEAEEILQVADAMRGMWMMRRFFSGRVEDAPLVSELGLQLPELDGVHETLYGAFDPSGGLADDASAELAELRARRRSLHDRIRARIHGMLHERGIERNLMDSYYTVREDRYVLPVRSGQRREVDGIIHGSSQTGATLFIEPAELVPVNNELKLCEQAVTIEEHRILAELTRLLGEHRQPTVDGLLVVAELDTVYARACLAGEMNATPPALSGGAGDEDSPIRLTRVLNPQLLLRGAKVVANDIELVAPIRFLVVTGPNAGGKTVTLSTLGLCALMVRAGMHLPAGPDSTLPIFERVLTVMGDGQDLQADLSTFSGHLERLQRLLDQVGSGSLVLLDELAVGTQPRQGAALAIAVLEALATRRATGAVTTHFERLKTLSLEDARFQNAAVGRDEDSGEPTFRLRLGMPGSSSGLDMALKLGFDQAIVTRAREILGDRSQNLEKVLLRLDEERSRLEATRLQVEAKRAELQREIDTARAEQERWETRGEEIVREERAAALAELDEARAQVARVVRELQAEPTARTVQRRRVKLAEIDRSLRQGSGEPATSTTTSESKHPPLPRAEVAEGVVVWVPAFGREGTIARVKGNKAEVTVGNLRTTVSVASLCRAKPAPAARAHTPAAKGPRSKGVGYDEVKLPPRSTDNTVDVRGCRLDEALEKVERFLDNALLTNRSAGYVLHGHGTGRLKTGLRQAFRGSAYVDRFEVASPDYGGDAVTVVWLK